jgi:hypothetical protein
MSRRLRAFPMALAARIVSPGDLIRCEADGLISGEFISEQAPYPSCHSMTIAETPTGLVASWFGGIRHLGGMKPR